MSSDDKLFVNLMEENQEKGDIVDDGYPINQPVSRRLLLATQHRLRLTVTAAGQVGFIRCVTQHR